MTSVGRRRWFTVGKIWWKIRQGLPNIPTKNLDFGEWTCTCVNNNNNVITKADYFFIALKATNLAPFPLDWPLFCLTFRLISLLKIQVQMSSDQNSENYFSFFSKCQSYHFLVILFIEEQYFQTYKFITKSGVFYFNNVALFEKIWPKSAIKCN